jgi:hypothetical protein
LKHKEIIRLIYKYQDLVPGINNVNNLVDFYVLIDDITENQLYRTYQLEDVSNEWLLLASKYRDALQSEKQVTIHLQNIKNLFDKLLGHPYFFRFGGRERILNNQIFINQWYLITSLDEIKELLYTSESQSPTGLFVNELFGDALNNTVEDLKKLGTYFTNIQ